MAIEGTVRDGVVVLDDPGSLPEGTKVRVEPVEPRQIPTIYERLAPVAGRAKTLPPDASENLDRDLYDRKCE